MSQAEKLKCGVMSSLKVFDSVKIQAEIASFLQIYTIADRGKKPFVESDELDLLQGGVRKAVMKDF